MARLLQTLFDSLTVGSLYALIALGYTMVYGILQFINFAHSDVFMLGAWFSFELSRSFGWSQNPPPAWAAPLVLVLAMALCGLVGFTIERLAYKPLRKAPRLNVLITAIGVSLLIENVGQSSHLAVPFILAVIGVALAGSFVMRQRYRAAALAALGAAALIGLSLVSARAPLGAQIAFSALIAVAGGAFVVFAVRAKDWSRVALSALGTVAAAIVVPFVPHLPAFGTQPQSMPALIDVKRVVFSAAGVDFHFVDLIVIGVAIALMVVLQWLVFGTKLGLGMRAVSYDTRTASLMGINVDAVISFTFVTGSALAAAAGLLFGIKYSGLKQPADSTWVLLGLKAFVAAVVGGIGNIRGAVLGGVMIGLLEQFGAAYVDARLRDVYVFVLLIVVLLVKPSGLLGRSVVEKV